MNKLFGTLALSLCLFLSSCATLTNGDARSQFFADMAITTATMKFIEGRGESELYARHSIDIAQSIKRYIDKREMVPIDQVMQAISAQIPWQKMLPSDAMVAKSFMQLMQMELEARVGENQMDEQTRIAVHKLADIVIFAASHYTE